jgi:hypothetical protein
VAAWSVKPRYTPLAEPLVGSKSATDRCSASGGRISPASQRTKRSVCFGGSRVEMARHPIDAVLRSLSQARRARCSLQGSVYTYAYNMQHARIDAHLYPYMDTHVLQQRESLSVCSSGSTCRSSATRWLATRRTVLLSARGGAGAARRDATGFGDWRAGGQGRPARSSGGGL